MRWFKHLSLSHNEKALSSLLDKFGAAGYGIFWLIVEKIALLMEDGSCAPEATYSLKTWALFCRTSQQKFNSVATLLEECGEFTIRIEKEFKKNLITINYPKLLKYKDEWTQRKCKNSGVTRESLGSHSGATPELRIDIDKNKDINIIKTNSNTTVINPTRAVNAKPVSLVQQTLTGGEPSARQELFACLEKYFQNLEYKLREDSKLSYMLTQWEGSGVVPEDIEAAVEHLRETRPEQQITSPMYYREIVLNFCKARKEGGNYDAARWGGTKFSSGRDALAEAARQVRWQRELERRRKEGG